jgi:hypothetical protein
MAFCHAAAPGSGPTSTPSRNPPSRIDCPKAWRERNVGTEQSERSFGTRRGTIGTPYRDEWLIYRNRAFVGYRQRPGLLEHRSRHSRARISRHASLVSWQVHARQVRRVDRNRLWENFRSNLDRGTLTQCGPFGIPSTSHWTGAAIIVWGSQTKTCIVTRPRASRRLMPSSSAG